jgi:hypothetical protein
VLAYSRVDSKGPKAPEDILFISAVRESVVTSVEKRLASLSFFG